MILAIYDVPSVRDSLIDRLRTDLEEHEVRLTCLDASHHRTGCELREPMALLHKFRKYVQSLRRRCEELVQDTDTHPIVLEAMELLARPDAAAGR